MVAKKKLTELGEFGLIEHIQAQAGSAPFLKLGIGDDCSILTVASDEELLTSTDLLIEGVHFDLNWTGFEQLGHKSIAVNISDIAAMGGLPKCLYLAVAVPPTLSVDSLEQFIGGVLAETKRHGAILAGGDTSRSSGPLVISVTVQGTVKKGQAVCRNGAKDSELIFVSGTLGDSALALTQFKQGMSPAPELERKHHCPQARSELGSRLAGRKLASSMIDISDGLIADLGHILAASTAGAVLNLEAIPLSPSFRAACHMQPEIIDLALTGGEDYELLFTVAPDSEPEIDRLATELNLPLTCIGSVEKSGELRIVRKDGSNYQNQQGGFEHFAEH